MSTEPPNTKKSKLPVAADLEVLLARIAVADAQRDALVAASMSTWTNLPAQRSTKAALEAEIAEVYGTSGTTSTTAGSSHGLGSGTGAASGKRQDAVGNRKIRRALMGRDAHVGSKPREGARESPAKRSRGGSGSEEEEEEGRSGVGKGKKARKSLEDVKTSIHPAVLQAQQNGATAATPADQLKQVKSSMIVSRQSNGTATIGTESPSWGVPKPATPTSQSIKVDQSEVSETIMTTLPVRSNPASGTGQIPMLAQPAIDDPQEDEDSGMDIDRTPGLPSTATDLQPSMQNDTMADRKREKKRRRKAAKKERERLARAAAPAVGAAVPIP